MRTALLAAALASACVIDELDEADVGDEPFCDAARQWPEAYAALETALAARIDRARRRGTDCGETAHNPIGELELVPELHCAARLHATYIAEHSGLSHEGMDHTTPLARTNLAGYDGLLRYELLARDFTASQALLDAWLADQQQCDALLDTKIVEIGVGHSRNEKGDATGWVVVLGERRP
ncbi:MAG TPA: CAP domain-containing protein [Nannocystaceae bacterium]|nr:CAP domain-containing protein [Nannocystaceae bacterium]